MTNPYGYDQEEWDTFPDETREEIQAQYEAELDALLTSPPDDPCGCAG